ncbi:MAG: hypothetical protein KDB88_02955 [Flavobacteriales bacterium]|nr:hypothetical protein [Flavobacteriales bacterium]
MIKLKREYSIALMAIAGVLLLVFGINYLKGLDLLQRRNVYHAVYQDISGVGETTPLFYNGYKIGSVIGTDLLPKDGGRIVVSFQLVENNLRIPKDSRVVITGDLLNKWTALEFGTSTELAEAGDTLMGHTPMSLTESVTSQIDPLKRKAEAMVVSIDSVLTAFQKVLNKDARMDIDASFHNIRGTLEKLNSMAARLDQLIAKESSVIEGTLENLNSVTGNLRSKNDQVGRILSNLDTTMSALADGRLQHTLASLDSTMSEVRDIIGGIKEGEGTLGKLVAQDSLYDNLNSASRELDLLLEDFRLNPNRYVHVSLFGRKDKLPKLSRTDVERIGEAMKAEQDQ